MDYCNGVFAGLPAGLFNRLQSLLAAARNSSSAYQAMHRSCQQSVTVIRFIGLVIFSVTLLDDLQMPARPGTNITSSGSGHRFPQSPVAHTCVLPINTNCSSPPHVYLDVRSTGVLLIGPVVLERSSLAAS